LFTSKPNDAGLRTARVFVAVVALASIVWLARPHARDLLAGAGQGPPLAPGERRAVLVELFTSEGCSSCPPADRLLIDLERAQPVAGAEIIPLSLHVDYWDGLGWRDPFSSSEFTVRQEEYRRAFLNPSNYTPQMVVDGAQEFTGSDRGAAMRAIARAVQAAKARVELDLAAPPGDSAVRLAVRVSGLPETKGDEAEVLLAVTESGLANNVARGENAGRRIEHTAVVRRLERAGRFRPGREREFTAERAVKLDTNWRRENLRAIAFVQDRKTRRILGAASIPIAAPATKSKQVE
jgi:hypothetical protein